MTGKTLNEFIETLYLGFDMEFEYKEKHYIIGGFCENDKHFISINECIQEKNGKDLNCFQNYSIIFEGNSFEDCVKQILKEKLIDGKTLFELEKDIIVLYG